MEDYDSWVGPLVNGKCKYFQDRGKRWPFYTNEKGYTLLRKLVDANLLLLKRNKDLIDATADPARAVREGESIYANKPTLKSKAGVTWSQDEYSHPGLQRMYLKMKSYQRYTETFSLLERAERLGVFKEEFSQNEAKDTGTGDLIRVAALGGGPGYELLAFRHFFESRKPGVKLEMTSWGQYASPLGFKFMQWDINERKLLEKLSLEPGQLDYIIISYVFIYCTNQETCEFLKRLLTEGKVKAIIVSERSEATEACVMIEKLGVKVERLMSQNLGRDERQNLFLPPGTQLSDKASAAPQPMTFPNVPFEEHKKARQAGGHRLGWRPFHDESPLGRDRNKRYRPGTCFAFQRGRCDRGSSCRYSHVIDNGDRHSPQRHRYNQGSSSGGSPNRYDSNRHDSNRYDSNRHDSNRYDSNRYDSNDRSGYSRYSGGDRRQY